jgi:hypothetical protein
VSAVKIESGWARLKAGGIASLPQGDATRDARRIIDDLKSMGLAVLSCGELECYAKSVSGHGPDWVEQVLEKDVLTDPELEEARIFVLALYVLIRQRMERE